MTIINFNLNHKCCAIPVTKQKQPTFKGYAERSHLESYVNDENYGKYDFSTCQEILNSMSKDEKDGFQHGLGMGLNAKSQEQRIKAILLMDLLENNSRENFSKEVRKGINSL